MRSLLLLGLPLLLSSCLNSPAPSSTPEPPLSAPQPPSSAAPRTLGLMELNFQNLGAGAFRSSVRMLSPSSFSGQALTTQPSGADLDADGIQFSSAPIQRSAFSFGGFTYFSATYGVRNADITGKAYSAPLRNLTFLAIDTSTSSAAGIPKTALGTAFSRLSALDGTDASSLAPQMRPTHGMRQNLGNPVNAVWVASGQEDFQGFRDGEVSSLGGGITPNDVNPLGYGFVARCTAVGPLCLDASASGDGRTFAAPSSNASFPGRVTFAVKVPNPSDPQKALNRFSVIFAAVTDDQTFTTESLEEQGRAADVPIVQRLSGVSDGVRTLPGTTLTPQGNLSNPSGAAVRYQGKPSSGRYLVEANTLYLSSRADGTRGSFADLLGRAKSGNTVLFDLLAGQTASLSSTLTLNKNLTLAQTAGAPAVLSGADAVRLLEVSSGISVTLRGFALQNGLAPEGGCLYNAGKVTLEDMTFSGCTAQGAAGADGTVDGNPLVSAVSGGSARGGAVFNAAGATLNLGGGVAFSDNRAVGGAGGIGASSVLPPFNCTGLICFPRRFNALPGSSGGAGQGGAIFSQGTLVLGAGVRFEGNRARGGVGGAGGTSQSGNSGAGGPGGAGQGGALYLENLPSSLTLPGRFQRNVAQGGLGGNGGTFTNIVAVGGSGGGAEAGAIYLPVSSSVRCASFGSGPDANSASTGAQGNDSDDNPGVPGLTTSPSDVGPGSFDPATAGC